MKKSLLIIASITLFLSSCNIVKVAVGDVSPTEPTIEVGSQRNHFFIGGLVRGGKSDLSAKDFVGDRDGYIVKTKTTFVNGLVTFFSGGIYTPTTTSFLIPFNQFDQYNNNESAPDFRKPKKEKKRRFLKTNTDEDNSIEIYTSREPQSEEIEIINKQKGANDSKQINDFDYLEERTVNKPIIIEEEEVVIEKPVREAKPQQAPKSVSYPKTQPEAVKPQNTDKQISKKAEVKEVASENGYKAIIYFKSGAKMNGTVTELPSGDITIKFPGGTSNEFKMKDIEKIERR